MLNAFKCFLEDDFNESFTKFYCFRKRRRRNERRSILGSYWLRRRTSTNFESLALTNDTGRWNAYIFAFIHCLFITLVTIVIAVLKL